MTSRSARSKAIAPRPPHGRATTSTHARSGRVWAQEATAARRVRPEIRDGRREGSALEELTFSDLSALHDERVARAHEVQTTETLELGACCLEGGGDGVERRSVLGGAGDDVNDALLELLRPGEEHLPLVDEVAEERPLREPPRAWRCLRPSSDRTRAPRRAPSPPRAAVHARLVPSAPSGECNRIRER